MSYLFDHMVLRIVVMGIHLWQALFAGLMVYGIMTESIIVFSIGVLLLIIRSENSIIYEDDEEEDV